MILNKLQALYDSEINIKIEWFWDSGITWAIGDEMNGWKAERESSPDIESAIEDIWNSAKNYYPNATCFAKNQEKK